MSQTYMLVPSKSTWKIFVNNNKETLTPCFDRRIQKNDMIGILLI